MCSCPPELTFVSKSSLEVERGVSLVPPPGLTAVAASASPLVSLELAKLRASSSRVLLVVLLLVVVHNCAAVCAPVADAK